MKTSFLLFSIFYFLFSIDNAFATGLSLRVSPPTIQITAEPQESVKSPITIKNLGDSEVNLKIIVKPFTIKSETGEIVYTNQDFPIFEKIRILDNDNPINTITLAPKQEKILNLTIEIPENENISDYYFSIIFISTSSFTNPTPSPSVLEAHSQVLGGVATNILLSIGPKEKATTKSDLATGVIDEFSTPLFLTKGPVNFRVKIKNTGRHFISPYGTLIIKNMFGQTVGNTEIGPVNILAGTSRAIHHAYFNENFLIGLYTATLSIALTDTGPLLTKTVSFFGFPIQLVTGPILAILLILLIRRRLEKYK